MPAPAAVAAKKSLILPLLVAAVVAGSATAYFSGAFTPQPVQIAATPAPTANPIPAPEATALPAPAKPAPAAPEPVPVAALTALLTQTQDCGPLSLSNPPATGYAEGDAVQISGHVSSDNTAARLRDSLAAVIGKRDLTLQLEPMNPAICAVLNALPVVDSGQVAILLGYGDRADPNAEGRYLVGENPVIDLTVPGGAGYLSVAIVDGSGQVLHLLQGSQQAKQGKLRVAFAVNEAGAGRPALVVNPAGLGATMILAVRSEAALDTGPVIEPVAAFVARLKQARLISADQRLLLLTAP